MTEVFFATNRLADASAPGGFGALRAAEGPRCISYGTAAANGGRLGGISDLRIGQWSDATLDTIVHAGKPVLVSIHGFDYTFSDAIGRAGDLGDLYRLYGADTIMIAFTWPSAGELIEFGLPQRAYEHDQAEAAASGSAIAEFLALLSIVRGNLPAGTRMSLLCHSMGNYALAGALDALASFGVARIPIFDDVLLAAADERADSFSLPDGSRFGRLPLITARTSIYFAGHDEALKLSASPLVNGIPRLGQAGPAPALARTDTVRLVDCTAIDPAGFNPDDSHQYYRTVPAVIADIASVIAGRVGGLTQAAAA